MTSNHLLDEILEQPEALERVYAAYAAQANPALAEAAGLLARSNPVYFTGMATSEYASYPAASRLNRRGLVNFVYDVSELLYYHLPALQKGACLVLTSQSGSSAEIVHLLDELHGRVPVVGVFNNPESALARRCDIPLPILAGPQLACGSKTNLSSVAVLNLLAEAALGESLPQAGERLKAAIAGIRAFLAGWEQRITPAADLLEGAPYTVFLGRGPGRASAMFSAVLFREVPKVVAEGMGAALFRHGLREMIRPEHRVVLFAPQGFTQDLLLHMAHDLRLLGVPSLVVANSPVDLEPGPDCVILPTEPQDEGWAPLVDMVPLQLVGYELARRRGIEPGKLVISTYVTTEE